VEVVAYRQAAIDELERRAFSVQAIDQGQAGLGFASRHGTSRTAPSKSPAPAASSSSTSYSALGARSMMTWWTPSSI